MVATNYFRAQSAESTETVQRLYRSDLDHRFSDSEPCARHNQRSINSSAIQGATAIKTGPATYRIHIKKERVRRKTQRGESPLLLCVFLFSQAKTAAPRARKFDYLYKTALTIPPVFGYFFRLFQRALRLSQRCTDVMASRTPGSWIKFFCGVAEFWGIPASPGKTCPKA
jgi:hypothetical protein